MCMHKNIFQSKYSSAIPLEFKIMVALRILGRDSVADDIEELSGVGESTTNSIFKTFVKEFSTAFMDDYVHFPTGEDLLQCMELYRVLGVPGALGSVDCTHVRLRRCPVGVRWLCSGKEKFPTLSFLVVVDHNRRVQYVGPAHFGASNDKTISNNDPMMRSIHAGKFKDIEYILYNATGLSRAIMYILAKTGVFPNEVSNFM